MPSITLARSIARRSVYRSSPVYADGVQIGDAFASHTSGWQGGGAFYSFTPSAQGKALGYAHVPMAGAVKALLRKIADTRPPAV